MCHICAKGFLDSIFKSAVIDKISIFHELGSKFHLLIIIVILIEKKDRSIALTL